MADLKQILETQNVAEILDEEELNTIGSRVLRGLDIDEQSRSEWMETVEKAMKIAKQVMEHKSHPWPNAANVKFPLITRSSIDFAARTYPEIIRNDKVVKTTIIGVDKEGQIQDRGKRVTDFLNWQLIKASDEWEDGTDRLLHMLPVVGVVFRKIYYDPLKEKPCTYVCSAKKVVINHNVKSLSQASRISHLIEMSQNEIIEKQRSGRYLDISLKATDEETDEDYDVTDEDRPLEMVEQHCNLDLDYDGYSEPYIVTVHKTSGKVLRIAKRFSENTIAYNDKQEVVKIDSEGTYFVDYHFLPNPDGGFYSLGLGHLLYPLNEAINTLINQLIDAGTLNNRQGGFIGRGLRLRQGDMQVRLGEWKTLDAAPGTDIKNNIVPLPTKEPSTVLFQMLGFLVDVGKDLSTVQDVLQGKGPAQNVPATTILTLVENGLKVFNSIQKRLHRSFKKEFKELYRLNALYLDDVKYSEVLNIPVRVKEDFDLSNLDIIPVSDPMNSTDAQRIAKAQAVAQVPGLNVKEQTKYYLEALQFEDYEIEKLMKQDPEQKPDPKEMEAQIKAQKMQHDMKIAEANLQLDAQRVEIEKQRNRTQEYESAARIVNYKQDNIRQAANTQAEISASQHKQAMEEMDKLIKMEQNKIQAAKVVNDARKSNKSTKD